VKRGYNVLTYKLSIESVDSNNAKAAYMEKKDLIPGGVAIHYLKTAALHPQRRGEMIARALQELLATLPAIGTALIWPCQDRNIPWKIYYAGTHTESIRRWLAARLHVSLDATVGVLQQDLGKLSDMPLPPPLFHVRPSTPWKRFAGHWKRSSRWKAWRITFFPGPPLSLITH